MRLMDDQDERRVEQWHVGKEIPLAMILGMLVQSAGVVWWAATLSGKIDNLAEQVMELKSERNNHAIAMKDLAVLQQRVDANERRILSVEMNRSSR